MQQTRRRMPLHTKIFIGLLLGAIVGLTTQALTTGPAPTIDPAALKSFIDAYVQPVGSIFLYLIFMIVIPLLLSALILGVAEIGQAKRFGKVGLKSLIMTVVLSGIAVAIGLAAVNIVRPGEQLSAGREELIAKYRKEDKEQQFLDTAKKTAEDPPLLGFIPKNPIKETARDGLLPFMFFALMLGLALASIPPEKSLPVINFFEGLFAASLKIIEWAMKIAPIGVFFLIFAMTSQFGIELLKVVALYAVLVIAALALHLFGVYSLVLKFVAKRNPLEFFRQIRTVMLTAFATSSSNATLPVALESAQKDVGLPRDISSFVLTVGATANQNGTALFEGITILFLAQLFGVHLDPIQQLQVMGMAIVAGIGTAGVPGGAWPFIATILVSLGIPIEGIGLVYGIDRILDMSRTVLNVTGDITIAACVTQLEHRSDHEVAAALA